MRVISRCFWNARIGLLAVAGVVVLGGEAHGQGSVEADRAALEALYEATDGPNWWRKSNWLSDEPLSEWYGVLTNEQGRVRALILYENQLSGPIPPDLGQSTRLEFLSLYGNQLGGPIPPELGRLTELQILQLNENRLSGPIPPELGGLTRLDVLLLYENELSGPIPRELGRLTRMHYVSLYGNELSGPIPVELGNLTALTTLRIDSDTGLCLPREMQDTAFGRLATREGVPLTP